MEERIRMVSAPATPVASALRLAYAGCFSAGLFGGMLATLMSVYLPQVVAELLVITELEQAGTVGAFINAMFLFGWAVGGILWGMAGDWHGRSRVLALTIGFYSLFAMLTAMAPTWPLVVICRFLTGFGVGGMLVMSHTLITEIWPEKTRPVAMGILSVAFPLGIFTAGAVNMVFDDWRQAFLVSVLPALLALFLWRFLPESNQWNSRERRHDKPNVRAALRDPAFRLNIAIGSIIFGTMLIGLWAVFSWLPTWVESLLEDRSGSTERGFSMMIMGAFGIAGGFLSGLVVKLIGLKRTMILCYGVCFAVSALLFKGNVQFSPLIYFELALLAVFFGISQGTLGLYIPLLFPVESRGLATGLCFNFGRFVTATAVFFVGAFVVLFNGYGNAIFYFSFVFLAGLFTLLFSKHRNHFT